jgi:hypothetical protein
VLDRSCPECGFDASTFPAREVADALLDSTKEWQGLLSSPSVRVRPTPNTWSGLEYGCHVRDVFRRFDHRIRLMLTESDPVFENWDQDQTAIADRYSEQDPTVVSVELEQAAGQLAATLTAVNASDWARCGRRSDGSTFTIDTISRYMLHDPTHHVWDVTSGYERLGPLEPRDLP